MSNGASYFSLFIMLLLLYLTKHLEPTQRPLNSTSMLMKMFRIEDSIIVVTKNGGGGIMKMNHEHR
jgi:hypothetical protein